MSSKDKSAQSVTGDVEVGQEPWQHGDKPVVYISLFWWDALSVEDQTLMKETYRVTVLPKEPEV